MEILEIKNIKNEDVHIYYRKTYHGTAVISIPRDVVERSIQFTIETGPLGNKDIELSLSEMIDYPLNPLIKALKVFVLDLDSRGGLD